MRTTHYLTEYLRQVFPEWLVIDEPRTLDEVKKPTVIVIPDTITRFPSNGDVLAVSIATRVLLMSPVLRPHLVEENLDEAIVALLKAIEHHEHFTWETATRAGIEGGGHGYELTVTIPLQIEATQEKVETNE